MPREFHLQNFRCYITPLSPLYIGCGVTYTPMEYVIDQGVLYHFAAGMVPLSERMRKDLEVASDSSELCAVPALFAKNRNYFAAFADYAVEVDKKIEADYKRMTLAFDDRNQNQVFRTAFRQLPTGATAPYVPGSGLKGVIRTALVDRLSGNRIQQKGFEKELLGGDFEYSPLRFLKVGDFLCLRNPLMRVERCSRYYKAGSELAMKRSVFNKFEYVMPAQYRLFEGQIELQSPVEECVDERRCYQSMEEVARDLNRFYAERFAESCREELWQRSRLEEKRWIDECQRLFRQLAAGMRAGRLALIRIGGNVGAESMTLRNGSACIWNRQKKVDMKSATTAWTAQLKGNTLPFGWAVIEFAPEEDNAALRSWCGQFNRGVRSPESLVAELASRREAISAVLRKEQEERRRSDELAQRAREEQEKRAAEFASLPENKRLVHQIVDLMGQVAVINPGEQLYQKVFSTLAEACASWSADEQKYCAEKIGPLVKKKDMYKGKKAKELKTMLARLRQEM